MRWDLDKDLKWQDPALWRSRGRAPSPNKNPQRVKMARGRRSIRKEMKLGNADAAYWNGRREAITHHGSIWNVVWCAVVPRDNCTLSETDKHGKRDFCRCTKGYRLNEKEKEKGGGRERWIIQLRLHWNEKISSSKSDEVREVRLVEGLRRTKMMAGCFKFLGRGSQLNASKEKEAFTLQPRRMEWCQTPGPTWRQSFPQHLQRAQGVQHPDFTTLRGPDQRILSNASGF